MVSAQGDDDTEEESVPSNPLTDPDQTQPPGPGIDRPGHGPTAPTTAAPTPSEPSGALAGWLAALALTAVVTQVVNEVLVPPLVVFAVLFAVGSAKVRTSPSRRWRHVALGAVALYLAANGPFLVEDLAHPESAAGFSAAWLVLVCGVGAAITAGWPAAVAEPGRTRTVAATLAGVAVLGGVLAVVAAAGVTDDPVQPGDALLRVAHGEFDSRVELVQGDALVVRNTDRYRHTIVIEGADVRAELPAGADRRLELDGLAPGDYRYVCDVAGHTMTGTLVVAAA